MWNAASVTATVAEIVSPGGLEGLLRGAGADPGPARHARRTTSSRVNYGITICND